MNKILLLLLVGFTLIADAKVITLYYGPNHEGKYLEMILHGDEAIAWKHDSISRYSHSRVEKLLNDSHLWRIKYVKYNESDNTLVFHNMFHKPVRMQYVFTNDMSTLEIKDLRNGADVSREKLPLVDIHIDSRAGTDEFIGEPKLRVSVLDSKDKSSDNND